MPVDCVHTIDDGDFQARCKRFLLKCLHHRIPTLGCVFLRRASAATQNRTDVIPGNVTRLYAVLFYLRHLPDLFIECHTFEQILQTCLHRLRWVGVNDYAKTSGWICCFSRCIRRGNSSSTGGEEDGKKREESENTFHYDCF